MRPPGFLLLLAALGCGPVMAGESSQMILELYRTGQYDAAIAAGEAAKDGESLAVASRAAFAKATLSDQPCLSCLQRAEDLARRSVALDTAHPEAFVNLAASLGHQARIVGNSRAQVAHYPEQAKAAVTRALAIAPNDPWALAAAGAWHIEIVRNGGILGSALYGARFETGTDYFRRAFDADPQNLVIRFQYALSVTAYDFDRYRERAMAELTTAIATEPRTAYEGAIKERAARLLDLAKTNRRGEYLALVKRYQGYP